MIIAYATDHHPPAPMLQVTVANVANRRRRRTLPALIDTGSDITAIPRELVEALQLYPISRLRLEGLESETRLVASYVVQFRVTDLVISRLEVVLTSFSFLVLGRDVINRLYVMPNGPEQAFQIGVRPLTEQ